LLTGVRSEKAKRVMDARKATQAAAGREDDLFSKGLPHKKKGAGRSPPHKFLDSRATE
jgi:hypothetical protein